MNLEKYSVRTDLAFESIDLEKMQYAHELIDEEYDEDGLIIKRTVVSENISREIGKKPGLYYAVDTSAIKTHDHDDLKKTEDALTQIIKEVLKLEGVTQKHRGLIVGLGNVNVTPDALGPVVIDNVIVTRHMFILNPEDVSEGVSDISAIAPGVMGNTGIETFDIIDAIIKKIGVDYVIVVDALASKSIARVNKTIQVTNTGISPGSGVGNKRKELSKETTGIPVIAIGVPTVVDAVTIVSDTIDFLLKYFNNRLNKKDQPSDKIVFTPDPINYQKAELPNEETTQHFLGTFGALSHEEKISLLEDVLTPNGYNMMVTPKEVDIDIQDLSEVISSAIDRAVHTIVDNNNIIT